MFKLNKKSPLVLIAVVSTSLIISSVILLPNPFSYITAIAICGPLSASLLGLKQ